MVVKYTLLKPVRKSFPRNPYTVTNIDDIWEMDLADVSSLEKYSKYKYLLKVIDIFEVCLERAFKGQDRYLNQINFKIFSKPITIQSDKGTEFVKASVQLYLKHQGLNFNTTHNPDINGVFIVF